MSRKGKNLTIEEIHESSGMPIGFYTLHVSTYGILGTNMPSPWSWCVNCEFLLGFWTLYPQLQGPFEEGYVRGWHPSSGNVLWHSSGGMCMWHKIISFPLRTSLWSHIIRIDGLGSSFRCGMHSRHGMGIFIISINNKDYGSRASCVTKCLS